MDATASIKEEKKELLLSLKDKFEENIKQYKSHEVEELVKKSKQLEQQVANKKK